MCIFQTTIKCFLDAQCNVRSFMRYELMTNRNADLNYVYSQKLCKQNRVFARTLALKPNSKKVSDVNKRKHH